MKKLNWIFIGIAGPDLMGTGFGGFNRRVGVSIPKGTKLKMCLRKSDGRRIIQTEFDEYFTLAYK